MFCPECGYKSDGAKYCPECGSPAEQFGSPQTSQQARVSTPQAQQAEDQSSVKPWTVVTFLILLIIAGYFYWQQSIDKTTSPTATEVTDQTAQTETIQESITFDRTEVEDLVRGTLYESTSVYFLTGCPENMTGVEGTQFTCEACPQDYVALDGDGWLTLGGQGPWRCDAAGGGWYIDLEISNGNINVLPDSIRNVS